MTLKRLEISGFKSFAKKTELIFDSPITSIVGPNGSGKSNVAEAFRWVLGEQSLKSLRGKRGEDLIFNGASSSGRLSRAGVSVTFDNRDRKFNVDFDEVTIAREVFRDGANEYSINGSQVRLRDIVELLSAVSLGASGHHIISQGEADRVLTANIYERRAMIEDALGLKIYQWKIQESQRKLEKTEENIMQVEALRREIAPHIKFLKKQVEKIEKTDEMRRELKALYLEYLEKEHAYLNRQQALISVEKVEPEAGLEEINKRLTELNATLGQAQGDGKNQQVFDLEKTIRQTSQRKDELSRSLGRLEGMLEIKREKLTALSEETGEDRQISFSRVAQLVGDIDRSLAQADQTEDVSVIRSVLAQVRQSIGAFLAGSRQEADTEPLKFEIDQMAEEKSRLEVDLSNLAVSEEKLNEDLANLKLSIESEREATRGAEREIYELRAKKSEILSKLEAAKAREEKLTHEEEDFQRELREAVVLTDREVLDYVRREYGEHELENRGIQEDRRRRLEKLKIRLEDMGIEGTDVIEEYKVATEREEFLTRELVDLNEASASLASVIVELRGRLDTEFKVGVNKINREFQNFFALMFDGGTASLQVIIEQKRRRKDTDLSELLSDEAIPADIDEAPNEATKEGIDINVSLPRKKIRGLQMLSGGERALTSIALLFAMSQVNPPPFLILDETDAALDEANSRKYGDMIESLAKYSQLILITHNRETMSRAGVLYGVTMGGDGISRLLSVRFDEALEFAK
jgi:chromosome segregation protein